MLRHLPNALTLLRLVLAPIIAWLFFRGAIEAILLGLNGDQRPPSPMLLLATALFLVAALSDLLDGVLARALKAETKFGRLIDPIADKALVGLPLLACLVLAILTFGVSPISVLVGLCVAIILIRDIAMTWIRLRAPDREGPRVTQLAKLKTAFEMIVVGYWMVLYSLEHLLRGVLPSSGEWASPLLLGGIWIALLAAAALLSAYTGYRYLAPGGARLPAKPE